MKLTALPSPIGDNACTPCPPGQYSAAGTTVIIHKPPSLKAVWHDSLANVNNLFIWHLESDWKGCVALAVSSPSVACLILYPVFPVQAADCIQCPACFATQSLLPTCSPFLTLQPPVWQFSTSQDLQVALRVLPALTKPHMLTMSPTAASMPTRSTLVSA